MPDMRPKYSPTRLGGFTTEPTESKLSASRVAALDAACAPFVVPALRVALAKVKPDSEQIIDTVTVRARVGLAKSPISKLSSRVNRDKSVPFSENGFSSV